MKNHDESQHDHGGRNSSDRISSDPSERGLAELKAILENAVDAIITIDERGKIQSVNPATETMFGYTIDEMVGQNVTLLMPPQFAEHHDEHLAEYKKTRQPNIIGVGREVVAQRKDGHTFPIHLAVSECNAEGKRFFTGMIRDLTEQHQRKELLERAVRERTRDLEEAQAQLVQQEKLAVLGRISGSIAHEIRNPLNAIKTSAYFLIHARSPTEEKRREHLQRIDRQVTLINNVITVLSDAARMPQPIQDPVSLASIIDEAFQAVELPASIHVRVEMADDLEPVWVDANQISIVLRNLFRNARDAMNQGGNLTITGENLADSNQVLLTVVDDGVGIDPSIMPRIREPLFTTKATGMGLGLSISFNIIETNRGTMEATSQPGVGTQFVLKLPTQSSVPPSENQSDDSTQTSTPQPSRTDTQR